MKLMLSRQRTWFAIAAGCAATVALPGAARPSDVAAPSVVAAEAAAPAAAVDPDVTIVSDITTRFSQDRELRRVRIGIGSENGIVTLAGTVPSSTARNRAEQMARETPGVFRVDNFLRLDVSSPEAPVPP